MNGEKRPCTQEIPPEMENTFEFFAAKNRTHKHYVVTSDEVLEWDLHMTQVEKAVNHISEFKIDWQCRNKESCWGTFVHELGDLPSAVQDAGPNGPSVEHVRYYIGRVKNGFSI